MSPQIPRREMIAMLGAAAASFALGCESATSPSDTGGGTSTGGTTTSACAVTPTETIQPHPVIDKSHQKQRREGKSGATLTLAITVVNSSANCSPVAGANVEIWQCDATGNYSQYGTQTSRFICAAFRRPTRMDR